MKIEQDRAAYRPITLTLETEREAQVLAAALEGLSGGGLENDLIFRIYDELTNLVDWTSTFARDGSIQLREL